MKQLLIEAELKFNEKIIDLGSSKRFSTEIYYETNKFLSYNTIRRIYGVVSSNHIKTRTSTLDLIAEYCGYKTFSTYKKLNKNNINKLFGNTIRNSLKYGNYDSVINEFKNCPENGYLNLLSITINKIIKAKNYKYLISLLEILDTEYNINNLKDNQSQIDFSNNIANQFNSIDNKSVLISLSKNKFFVKTYIHSRSEYSQSKNYNIVLKNTNNSDFSFTDNSYKALYLNNYALLIKKNLNITLPSPLKINYKLIENDYVIAKYFTHKLLYNEFVFSDYFISKNKNDVIKISGLLLVSLCRKNFDLFKQLINQCKYKLRTQNDMDNINDWLWYDIFHTVDLYLSGFLEKAIYEINKIDINKYSQIDDLDLQRLLYIFVKIIIKGPKKEYSREFKKINSKIYFNFINENLALDIRKMHYLK